MDTSHSAMDLSESSAPNMAVVSMPTDLQSTRDNTTAGDDESEDENSARQDNRTYQRKFCPKIFRNPQVIRKHTKLQHPSKGKNFKGVHYKRRFRTRQMLDRNVHFHSLNHPFKCTECDQMYRLKGNLEKHFQVFHDRNSEKFTMERFHCGSCELTFVEKRYCNLHSTIYHDRKPQRLKNLFGKIQVCERCVKTFDSRDLLMEHIRLTHRSDPPLKNFICKMCSKDLKRVFSLKIHILVTHFGIMPFVCQHCNAEFSTRRLLLKHMEKDHSKEISFKCPSCKESFTTKARMMKHKDKVHSHLEIEYDPQVGKTVYPCGKCEKKYESKDLLDKHLVKTHPSFTLMYKCPLCQQSVRYRKQHMRVHHGVEYDAKEHHDLVHYKCHCCSRLFRKKHNLLAHQNARSMKCDRCQKVFKTKGNFQAHMVAHQENKLINCEDCGLEFRCRRRLEEHRERYHSPTSTQVLSIFNCPYCPKMFSHPGNRARHIGIHHVQSVFQVNCGHCPMQLTDTVLLTKHYKTVHPGKPVTFKCPECEKFYLHAYSFKDHYKKHRKEAEESDKGEGNSTSKSVEEETVNKFASDTPVHRGTFKCKDCGLFFDYRRRLEEHQERYHSPTSTEVQSEIKVDCAHCSDQVTDTVQLRKHYKTVHPEEPVTFKCPKCEKCYLHLTSFKTHYKKHTKNAEAHDKEEVNSISESVEDRMKECGQVNYQTADAELESTVIKEEAIVQSEPIEDGVKENDQNAEGELVSIVIKEEAIVQSGNAAASAINAAAGINDSSLNTKEASDQGVMIEIKQEPLDNGEAADADAEEALQQEEQMEVDETIEKFTAETPAHRGNKSFVCKECGLDFVYRRRFEEHRERYHSPTSKQVLKIINCPYCPQLFTSPINRTRHIALKHVQSEFKVNCGHCQVQVTDTVLLRKHYKTVHPEELVTFKCPECEKFYLHVNSFKDHYKKHRKDAEAHGKKEANSTSELVEDWVNESGQTNDQTADAEDSIVIKKGATVQSGDGTAVSTASDAEENPVLLTTEELQQEEMEVDETNEKLTAETSVHRGHKSFKCNDCGLDFGYRRRFEEHQERYHSPTSTQVVKIVNCPYCPQLFISPWNRARHINTKHVQSEFKINCGHCPVQLTNTAQLRKHYKKVHPEERVMFKCPECEKFYLYWSSFKDHYEKHRKEAEAEDKAEMNITSEPVEDGMKECGQMNDRNTDGELQSIVIKEEAIVQSEPVEDRVNENDQNADEKLVSIEEVIVPSGNAAASGASAATGMKDNSLNTKEPSEQRVMNEIKQKPLDKRGAAIFTDLTKEDKSTAAEGTSEQKLTVLQEQKLDFVEAKKKFQESTIGPLAAGQSDPSVEQQVVSPASDAEEELQQVEKMNVDETIDKLVVKTPAHRGHKLTICKDCGLDFGYRRRLEEHRKRYHSPTSTRVLKIINCSYCPQLFISPINRARHIATRHVQSEIKVNCSHCPVQVTDTALLRKHYNTVHPEKLVKFKCPECEKLYRNVASFKGHYEKHRKEVGADDKEEMNNTSEPGDDGMKESGQSNDQIADGELELIMNKEEAIVLCEPVEDTVQENYQNADEKLVSIVIKEEVIVQGGNAAASGASAATGFKDNSLNTKELPEQEVVITDNGKAAILVDHTKEDQSTAAEETTEQKSAALEEQMLDFVEDKKELQESTVGPLAAEQSDPSVEQQVVSPASDSEENPALLTSEELQEVEEMDVDETIDKLVAKTPAHRGHKSTLCKDCGLDFGSRRRLEEHRKRYHSPTSTQVLEIINCPYCPQLFISAKNRARHIATKHVQSRIKVNCAHCPVQVTDTVQLRKHYKTVHPEKKVTFKCPWCEKFYLNVPSFKLHYKRHMKEARADDKAEMNSTSESGENVKENDQNADGELESIVIKEEAIVQSEPDEDGVKESGQTHDQNVDEELVSIIIKEKVFVQSGNAATSWVRETAGMQDNPLNTNERSEQGVMIEIKQEPLDNGEAETSTVLTECEKSRAEEGTSEQKSTLIEEQKVDFVEATNESTKEPKTAENPEPLAEQHAVSTESDAEEKPGLLLLEALEQAEQMDVDETIDKFTAETPTHRGHRWVKCEDCGLDFSYRRRLEEHRERYHSPTSTEVLKIINCPYCPKLFISASNRTHHIATKHVQTHFKINCAQCPMQVTDAVQLRKHYKTVHPEYLVTFKCPECWRSYLNLSSLKVHYKKHRKETEAHDKREVESTSESIEEGVKESGQTNDQTVDAELESIVIKEEAMV